MFNTDKTQMREIHASKNSINSMRQLMDIKIKETAEKELKLYGSPTSMFYGLKSPGKYKCITYIGEEYNISPDIIRTLQDLIIKKNYEHNIQKYFKIYSCPRTPCHLQYYPDDYVLRRKDSRVPLDTRGKKIKCLEKFQPYGNWRRENSPIERPYNACVEWGTHNTHGHSALKIGGIVFNVEREYVPCAQAPYHSNIRNVLQPVLKRTRDNGLKYDSDVKVIDKKTLYEACVNNCRYGDIVKKSWSKKELFAHLLKYG